MKFKKTILFFILTSCVFYSYTQSFFQTITILAADSLEGRAPATKSEEKTLEFLSTQLQNICDTVYKQPFSFTYKSTTATTNNLIAFQNNHQEKTIIFVAHYDHLGWGNAKSKEIIKKHQIHNGADDNASGVAMIVQLADALSQKDSSLIKYNYLYLFTSAHELGLFGAKHFLSSKEYQNIHIRAVLNFDMIGRLNTSTPILKIGGKDTDSTFHKQLNAIADTAMQLRFVDDQLLASDATPFYEVGVPVLSFTTGVHEDYHRASDDVSKINYEGLQTILDFIMGFIYSINQKE